ncbi:hypothetical protein [Aerococcus urinaeequi]|uniref:hypothetical protein n=1 Tax=Aerococcus urinaeequi TaxID=51665 RepID=UPI000845F9A5|nr:hypothetical protein [Aerococcus urinaeequi]
MIITLEEARKLNSSIEQDDLDAFETSVRELTNNNFQNKHVRFKGVEFVSDNIILVKEVIRGLRVGDTIEVNYSHYNDGLFTVASIDGKQITVEGTPFFEANSGLAMVTKVEYPSDIKRGIKKLIEYDVKMADKVGIKSETISRMSTTYYDVNGSDNTDGYPSSLLSFLEKYEKMRW